MPHSSPAVRSLPRGIPALQKPEPTREKARGLNDQSLSCRLAPSRWHATGCGLTLCWLGTVAPDIAPATTAGAPRWSCGLCRSLNRGTHTRAICEKVLHQKAKSRTARVRRPGGSWTGAGPVNRLIRAASTRTEASCWPARASPCRTEPGCSSWRSWCSRWPHPHP